MSQNLKHALIFIGPPGAGKGTLSLRCVDTFNWGQLSTGNLLRNHVAKKTSLGREIGPIIESGNLISDELITQVVLDWLKTTNFVSDTVILDGYPRSLGQARIFNELLKKELPGLQLRVIKLDIDDEELVARLTSRVVCQNKDCQAVFSKRPGSSLEPKKPGICDKCGGVLGVRKDDDETVIRKRLAVYRTHEDDLISFYKDVGIPIISLNADVPVETIFTDFKRLVAGSDG